MKLNLIVNFKGGPQLPALLI